MPGPKKSTTGVNFKRLHGASDGCSCQFKCGEAIALNRAMMREPMFKGVLYYEHTYGGTSHFKGRHDSEGGAAKTLLANAVMTYVVDLLAPGATMLSTAQQFVDYANNKLTVPARQQEPSQAHRDRAKVQQREFLLVPSSTPMEVPPKPDGIQDIHRIVYSSDPEVPARWSQLSCICSSCIQGAFDKCVDTESSPMLVPCSMRLDSAMESRVALMGKDPKSDEERLVQTLLRMERTWGVWSAVVEKRSNEHLQDRLKLSKVDMKEAMVHLGCEVLGTSASKPDWLQHTQSELDMMLERAEAAHDLAMEGPRDSGMD